MIPAAQEILRFHDSVLAAPGSPPRFDAGLWAAIEANHWHNCMLWEQEDLARRKHVPDAEIAGNKRAIDAHNQKRNDAVERIDEAILTVFEKAPLKPGARLNSETAGAMIDRLSILSLKIHAMRKQTERTDVDQAHLDSCRARLAKLTEQRQDLGACLDRLLAEFGRGEAYYKVYPSKMYSDPKLKPALFGEKR